jgi:hypothetical protein
MRAASQKHLKYQHRVQIIVSARLVAMIDSESTSHFCASIVYYRIYAEDGAIPSKTPVAPGYPFLGRIQVKSVSPPRNLKAVKGRIMKVENIKDSERTCLFLTPYSQSPMDGADKFSFLNDGTGPGSTPQEPLALVAKLSDSERRALESDGRAGLVSAAVPQADTRYGMFIQHSPTYVS